ncbi:LytR C-terminal domain-containing protein [Candidatus Daviesbacteria bacterium]|nr:LytR C-terminal domain-containing protein [Candidatus Daviesbacteria bacterium]
MSESVSKKSTSKALWRKYQHRAQTRKRFFLGLAILLLVLGLVLISKLTQLIVSTQGPSLQSADKHYTWDGTSTINLVVKARYVYAVSFNPFNATATVLKIPDDTYLTVSRGFGRWPTSSIYDLGQSSKPPMGASLLKESIGLSFGVPVDGYLAIQGSLQDESFDKVLEGIRKNPLSGIRLISSTKTDLSFAEFFKLVWGLKDVRTDKIKYLDLGRSQITESILLPDKSRALGVDQIKLDQLIQKQFTDSRLSDDGLTVGVYNGTNQPGLAERVARILTNMGARVIITSNSPTSVGQSIVVGRSSYTKTRLTQVFAPACLQGAIWPLSLLTKSKCDIKSSPVQDLRADVSLILGDDYLQKLDGKN